MTNFDWLTDLHPLFEAQDSWLAGTYHKPVHTHLICPSSGPFYIACGAGLLAEHIRRFKFEPPIIRRLGQVTNAQGQSMFQESFLNHLQRLRLRCQINAAPEGTLLLPGEPVLTIEASELQFRLLSSAIRLLIWESSYWASKTALSQWKEGRFSEEDTPHPPHFPFNPQGWKARAMYIGGHPMDAPADNVTMPLSEWPGFSKIENAAGWPLAQIRRLFKGEHPLGDVWLSDVQDTEASVSHTHIQFSDENSGSRIDVQMTRFQNLMQPVLVKGHPALSSPSLDYLRQRTWKQLEAFQHLSFKTYQRGWLL